PSLVFSTTCDADIARMATGAATSANNAITGTMFQVGFILSSRVLRHVNDFSNMTDPSVGRCAIGHSRHRYSALLWPPPSVQCGTPAVTRLPYSRAMKHTPVVSAVRDEAARHAVKW